MARPDASSSLKPLTTRNSLEEKPLVSFKPETLPKIITGALSGNFLRNNIVRIELIAKKDGNPAEKRQLRVFSGDNSLVFAIYATRLLLKDNPAANNSSPLQVFRSLLLTTVPQATEQLMCKLQNDIVAYQDRRNHNNMPNDEYVAILCREHLPNGWGPWQRSVQPLV